MLVDSNRIACLNDLKGVISAEAMASGSPANEAQIYELLVFLKVGADVAGRRRALQARAAAGSEAERARQRELCQARGSGLHSGIVGRPSNFVVVVPSLRSNMDMLDLLVQIVGPQREFCREQIRSQTPSRALMESFLRESFDRGDGPDLGEPISEAELAEARERASPRKHSKLGELGRILSSSFNNFLSRSSGSFQETDPSLTPDEVSGPRGRAGDRPLGSQSTPRDQQPGAGGGGGTPVEPGKQIIFNYEYVDSQRVKVTYIPENMGVYEISVFWQRRHISGSPFRANVMPPLNRQNYQANAQKESTSADLESLRAVKSNYIANHKHMEKLYSVDKPSIGAIAAIAALTNHNAELKRGLSSMSHSPGAGSSEEPFPSEKELATGAATSAAVSQAGLSRAPSVATSDAGSKTGTLRRRIRRKISAANVARRLLEEMHSTMNSSMTSVTASERSQSPPPSMTSVAGSVDTGGPESSASFFKHSSTDLSVQPAASATQSSTPASLSPASMRRNNSSGSGLSSIASGQPSAPNRPSSLPNAPAASKLSDIRPPTAALSLIREESFNTPGTTKESETTPSSEHPPMRPSAMASSLLPQVSEMNETLGRSFDDGGGGPTPQLYNIVALLRSQKAAAAAKAKEKEQTASQPPTNQQQQQPQQQQQKKQQLPELTAAASLSPTLPTINESPPTPLQEKSPDNHSFVLPAASASSPTNAQSNTASATVHQLPTASAEKPTAFVTPTAKAMPRSADTSPDRLQPSQNQSAVSTQSSPTRVFSVAPPLCQATTLSTSSSSVNVQLRRDPRELTGSSPKLSLLANGHQPLRLAHSNPNVPQASNGEGKTRSNPPSPSSNRQLREELEAGKVTVSGPPKRSALTGSLMVLLPSDAAPPPSASTSDHSAASPQKPQMSPASSVAAQRSPSHKTATLHPELSASNSLTTQPPSRKSSAAGAAPGGAFALKSVSENSERSLDTLLSQVFVRRRVGHPRRVPAAHKETQCSYAEIKRETGWVRPHRTSCQHATRAAETRAANAIAEALGFAASSDSVGTGSLDATSIATPMKDGAQSMIADAVAVSGGERATGAAGVCADASASLHNGDGGDRSATEEAEDSFRPRAASELFRRPENERADNSAAPMPPPSVKDSGVQMCNLPLLVITVPLIFSVSPSRSSGAERSFQIQISFCLL